MNKLFRLIFASTLFLFFCFAPLAEPAQNFEQAKRYARDLIYHDQTQSTLGTIYCGCQWQWTTRTGGQTNLASCGYEVRKNKVRAERTEWEHVVPAWVMGHQRQCWQSGGRKNCTANDPVFNLMEADLHNLAVSIGEVNGDRSNFRYGMVNNKTPMYGQCASYTDFSQRIFEPRDEVKGFVARITFYMYDRYDLNLSRQQQQLLMAWDKMYPPQEWEKIRDNRIASVVGFNNPFVTGQKQWTLGYKPSGEGLTNSLDKTNNSLKETTQTKAVRGSFIGNKNSKIYHPPSGCSGANRLPAEKNRVYFQSEAEAVAAGYRISGHCKAH